MFNSEDLKYLDPQYFYIIATDAFDVTIMSRNTGHYWYLHNPEYPECGQDFRHVRRQGGDGSAGIAHTSGGCGTGSLWQGGVTAQERRELSAGQSHRGGQRTVLRLAGRTRQPDSDRGPSVGERGILQQTAGHSKTISQRHNNTGVKVFQLQNLRQVNRNF